MNPSIDLKGLTQFLSGHALSKVEKLTGIEGLGELAKPLVNGAIEHLGIASFELDPLMYAMGRITLMGMQAQQARTQTAKQMEEEKK